MIVLLIIATVISAFAFAIAAIKLWKKDKPLYFQILTCAIGCYALFELAVLVMTYCNINQTYFNTSFFGLIACDLFLFCANRGDIEKIFEKPKRKSFILSIVAGALFFIASVVIGIFYFKTSTVSFYLFILIQIPTSFVVYFNVRHLLSPSKDQSLKRRINILDIGSLVFCVLFLVDFACWINVSTLTGIMDLVTSLVVLALSILTIKGAEKWNI